MVVVETTVSTVRVPGTVCVLAIRIVGDCVVSVTVVDGSVNVIVVVDICTSPVWVATGVV
jgi:hypothetical protein